MQQYNTSLLHAITTFFSIDGMSAQLQGGRKLAKKKKYVIATHREAVL
jgi:hypothetical protein